MKFDEGFNNLPLDELPLGAARYVRLNHGIRPPADPAPLSSSDLKFFVYPFTNKQIATIPVLPNDKDKLFWSYSRWWRPHASNLRPET